MGRAVVHASVSVDGFIADEDDRPGPLFGWLTSGDVGGQVLDLRYQVRR